MKKNITKLVLLTIAVSAILFTSTPTYAAEKDVLFNPHVRMTNEELMIIQDDLSFQKETGMTAKELLNLYEYYQSISVSKSSNNKYSERQLDDFANYAVEIGLIGNSTAEKNDIKVSVIRASFKILVEAGKKLGYTTAATLLNHSLQDYPSSFTIGSSSSYATQIQNSKEYRDILKDFRERVSGANYSRLTYKGSTTLNSSTDLHLSYNKVKYSVDAKKKNNRWQISVVFTDVYDFEPLAWKKEISDEAVIVAINNYAANAQSIGAIVPFDISITVEDFLQIP